MSKARWTMAILSALLVLTAVLAPIGPMPGIWLSGANTPAPHSWGDTADVLEVKLQVGAGSLGRTVIIWVVQVDGDLYVTGQQDSGWVRGIGMQGPVRLQLRDTVYALHATAVEDVAAAERVLIAWQDKYRQHYPDMIAQFPSAAEALQTGRAYRLTPRP